MTCVQLGTYILHTRLQPLAHTYYILASNHLHIHTCKLNPFFFPHTSHATHTSHPLTPVFRSCGNRLGIRASCQRLLRHGHRPPLVQHVRRRSLQARQVCAFADYRMCSLTDLFKHVRSVRVHRPVAFHVRHVHVVYVPVYVCARQDVCVCVCVCVRACVCVCTCVACLASIS